MSHSQDPTDLRAQEAAKAEQAERAAQAQREEVEDLKWWLSSPRGRRMAYKQLVQAGVFRSSFNVNAAQMAFSEGLRNQGLRLLNDINAYAPDRYVQMMKENTNV